MIVIPMLGKSSRFFEAGYSLPKYQLPLGGETVFAKTMRTFEKQFSSVHFLFLIRADHDSLAFVTKEIIRLGIKDFRVIEFHRETRGQAESVAEGIVDYDSKLPLIIFNIDTIRMNFEMPQQRDFGDGFLEVFQAEGTGWSFVEPGSNNKVVRTTEKKRISSLCSNGLYGFAKSNDFRLAFQDYIDSGAHVDGEIYIAPLYNYLIKRGANIKYRIVDEKFIKHCGVPNDYEFLKASLR
jgi:hypothetical protein